MMRTNGSQRLPAELLVPRLVYAAWVLLVSLALFRIARVRPGRPAEGASRGAGHHPHTFRRGSHDHITWCPAIR